MIPVRVEHPEGLTPVAEALLQANRDARFFAFYGEMGAGKTTFIAEIAKLLGVQERISSPTYGLVHEYLAAGDGAGSGEPVYHFDFYRIKSLEEVFDMGYEEYFDSGKYCLIEWPERIAELIPAEAVKVHIDIQGNAREISWSATA